jgi:carboxyl-terminal processing protease
VKFEAAGGFEPAPVEVRPTIKALERPLFQYAYQLADDRGGNGDGRIQRGEAFSLRLTVKNIGKGRSFDSKANLASLSGDGLFLRTGTIDISNMNPGEVKEGVFMFEVEAQLQEAEASLSLSVGDRDLREYATEKIKIPVLSALSITKETGTLKAGTDGATLLVSPDASAMVFGRLRAGDSVALLGKSGDFYKIDLGNSRFAFVPASQMTPGGTPTASPEIDFVYAHAPPTLEIAAAGLATRDDKMKISGVAFDGERLLDMYVFVGSRKLYYKSNRDGADPKKTSFDFDAPLRPGVNVVTVVARENPDTVTRRTIIIRKDAADGAILKTPKTDDPVADWLGEPGVDAPED